VSGICRAQYNEMIGLKGPDKFLPHLLGHEASAIVVKSGPGVKKVKKGDYVILSWIKGKGLDGINSQYCCEGQAINAGGVTTFGEHSVVSENRVTKIPKKIPPDVAAIIGCAVLTGAGIVDNTLKVKRGSSLAVFGAGGVGLCAIMAAKRVGCRHIIAVDVVDKKLTFAQELGATESINSAQGNVIEKIKSIAPAGLDYAIDASGNKLAMETAFAALHEKGTLVIAGNLSKDEKISIHPFELIKGKKILGTWGGEAFPDRDIPRYIKAYLQGSLPLGKLITNRFSLGEINQAFEVLKGGEAGRIVIEIAKK
jgi:S-(hydroxymethyl)glutathione dehydrogenase/alcohol dehydrogenase